MLNRLIKWFSSKLFSEANASGARVAVETTERKTFITLNTADPSGLNITGNQADPASKRLVAALTKAVRDWSARETLIERLAPEIAGADYTGDDYPRTGCTLTINAREGGGFGVFIEAPDGRFVESWPCPSPELLGLRVARWAAGKCPIRPNPKPALINHVRDFVELPELKCQHAAAPFRAADLTRWMSGRLFSTDAAPMPTQRRQRPSQGQSASVSPSARSRGAQRRLAVLQTLQRLCLAASQASPSQHPSVSAE